MSQKFKHLIKAPRMWLTAGSFLLGASMLLGYVHDQKLADQTLAQKVGLPDPVLVQDFDPEVHANMLNEVSVLAEVHLGHAAIRYFGEGADQERFVFLPVYPVSEGGRARALSHIAHHSGRAQGAPRPVARPSGARNPQPAAIFVYDVTERGSAPRILRDFGLQMIGEGYDGIVVSTSGAIFNRAFWDGVLGGDAFEETLDEMLGPDAAALPLVSPYVAPKTSAAPVGDDTRKQMVLFWVGFLVIVIGGGMMVYRRLPKRGTSRRRGAASSNATNGLHPLTFFQPIASQEEIIESEFQAAESRQHPMRAALGDVAHGFLKAFGRFKSRP